MLDKFLRYISVDTQSDDTNTNCPSSPGQLDLAKILVDELKEMGIDNAHMDENGYVCLLYTSPSPRDRG